MCHHKRPTGREPIGSRNSNSTAHHKLCGQLKRSRAAEAGVSTNGSDVRLVIGHRRSRRGKRSPRIDVDGQLRMNGQSRVSELFSGTPPGG